jgi:hypothetical protein
MTGTKTVIILIAASIIVAVLLAGCTSPTSAPSVTPAPSASPTISPAPTLIGGNDEAIIDFSYVSSWYGMSYSNLRPPPEGCQYYVLDVTVDSDKPVQTDGTWFTVEYRRNATEANQTYQITTVVDYPETTIGNGSKPATGRLLLVLPSPGDGSYGPIPIYFKPLDRQEGQYKVYSPVRGYVKK